MDFGSVVQFLERVFKQVKCFTRFIAFSLSILAVIQPLYVFGISEQQATKKIHAYLLIEDVASAVQAAKNYLALYPNSKPLQLALVRALCQSGNEIEALEFWNALSKKDQELVGDRSILETLAWSVLKKGNHSQQMLIKLFSLVGVALTRDAQGIPFLIEHLRSSNALFRSVAIHLAAEYGDMPLRDEIVRLLREEPVWHVRIEAIKAVGKLHMTEQKEFLKELIAHPKTLMEEKAAAITALVNICEGVDVKELQTFIHSKHAGLRELACEMVAHCDLKEHASLILPLLQDSNPQVRLSALNVWVLLDLPQPQNLDKLLRDPSPEVAITAAWGALVKRDGRGKEHLKMWIKSSDVRWRRLASAALAAGGKEGAILAYEMLDQVNDLYAATNLALGLIGQRYQLEAACSALDKALQTPSGGLWMWENAHNPLFRSLAPSTLSHIPQMPDYPHTMDQLTRLELLSILCTLHYPHALEAMKNFLQHPNWGATGAAAMTLVREGDEEAMQVVRQLLKDPDAMVRIQAALILNVLGSDLEAIQTLEQAYPHVDRELKIRILEALANVGDPATIPFLLRVLNEPFQVLRVIAASALIQCLTH